jgi:hypothetical protein
VSPPTDGHRGVTLRTRDGSAATPTRDTDGRTGRSLHRLERDAGRVETGSTSLPRRRTGLSTSVRRSDRPRDPTKPPSTRRKGRDRRPDRSGVRNGPGLDRRPETSPTSTIPASNGEWTPRSVGRRGYDATRVPSTRPGHRRTTASRRRVNPPPRRVAERDGTGRDGTSAVGTVAYPSRPVSTVRVRPYSPARSRKTAVDPSYSAR